MFPFLLLQFGSVALYPIIHPGAKTPTHFTEPIRTSTFPYRFFLLQPILILIICIIYSILPSGGLILGFGWVYLPDTLNTNTNSCTVCTLPPPTLPSHIVLTLTSNGPLALHRAGLEHDILPHNIHTIHAARMAGVLAINHTFTRSLLIVSLLSARIWLAWMFSFSCVYVG